jgi:hypothetical protein
MIFRTVVHYRAGYPVRWFKPDGEPEVFPGTLRSAPKNVLRAHILAEVYNIDPKYSQVNCHYKNLEPRPDDPKTLEMDL